MGWVFGAWALCLVIPLMDEGSFSEWLGWAAFTALLFGLAFGVSAAVS